MKKQHWIALTASIIALLIFIRSMGYGYMGETTLQCIWGILYGIAMIILPWVMAYKRKIGGSVCAGLCSLVKIPGIIDIPLYFSSGIALYLNGKLPLLDLIQAVGGKVLCLLGVVFFILVTVRLFKQVSPWVLFVYPVTSLIMGLTYLTDFIDYGITVIWNSTLFDSCFMDIVLILSVYLLVKEEPTSSGIKEKLQKAFLSGDTSGYTYLDEYKKNMKK